MKITVLGAGSIGLLFAAYLSKNGNEVTVVTRSQEQTKNINEKGIVLVKRGNKTIYSVTAYSMEEYLKLSEQKADLLVVAVKQIHLKGIEPNLLMLTHRFSHLLFIQNGMGHISLLDRIKHASIILGVVEHGALKLNDNIVEHTGIGMSRIAAYIGNVPEYIIDQVLSEDFDVKVETNWYEMLAKKLVINSVINPLTAVFNLKNGELIKSQHLLIEMKKLFCEAINTLELQNKQELWEQVIKVCENTAKNTSSMLRDVQSKQPTEIEAISGFLIHRAAELGQTVPFTEFVYNRIKGMEKSWNKGL